MCNIPGIIMEHYACFMAELYFSLSLKLHHKTEGFRLKLTNMKHLLIKILLCNVSSFCVAHICVATSLANSLIWVPKLQYNCDFWYSGCCRPPSYWYHFYIGLCTHLIFSWKLIFMSECLDSFVWDFTVWKHAWPLLSSVVSKFFCSALCF